MTIDLVYIDRRVFDEIVTCVKKYKETGDVDWLKPIGYLDVISNGTLNINLPEEDA